MATRGSILYFLIVDMSQVNIMYQTSLRQFLGLFDKSIEKSPKSPVTSKRINSIIDYLTHEVFSYTCRGLYERDKFIFTLLMTIKIQIEDGRVKKNEFQIFIKGKKKDLTYFFLLLQNNFTLLFILADSRRFKLSL